MKPLVRRVQCASDTLGLFNMSLRIDIGQHGRNNSVKQPQPCLHMNERTALVAPRFSW